MANAKEPLAGLPRRVDGIQVAGDGTIVARMNPAEESGWFDELVVSTDDGRSFEPALPLRGRTGRRRRGTRPRWIEPVVSAGKVVLDAGFEAFMREVTALNGEDRKQIDWVLDSVQPQIKHRVIHLGERPPATDVLLGQLRVLTDLGAQFDPAMRDAVAEHVVPVVQAVAVTPEGRRDAVHIAAVAAGIRPPGFRVRFG